MTRATKAEPMAEHDELISDDAGDYYGFDDTFDCEDEPECCPSCGKPYEDFSDLGCGRCDRRSPEWGIL